jgi:hypothetical protein
MNAIKKVILALILGAGFVQFSGCSKSSPALSPSAAQLQKLTAKNWSVNSVMVDGTDKTTVYAGLTVKFTSTDFTSTNGGSLWPASEAWSFKNADAKVIVRADGLEITIDDSSTTSKLLLTLDWTKTTLGGRVASVSGHHVFEFH